MHGKTGAALALVVLVAATSAAGRGLRGGERGRFARGIDCSRSPDEPESLRGVTAAHNGVRAKASAADGLLRADLEWSCELGNVAQAYADVLAARGCSLIHSGSRFGENLFAASGFEPSPRFVVDRWASEVACTRGSRPDSRSCTPVDDVCTVCGHYTQVVWRTTARLGCGVASCGEERVWVCNYDPPGNVYPR